MSKIAGQVLEYAPPVTRRWSRWALASLGWALVTNPVVAFWVYQWGPVKRVMGDHFFCCNQRWAAWLVFVVVPALGAGAGALGILNLAGRWGARGEVRGWLSGILGFLLGLVAAGVGFILNMAIRA